MFIVFKTAMAEEVRCPNGRYGIGSEITANPSDSGISGTEVVPSARYL